jgi:hypothetical protein
VECSAARAGGNARVAAQPWEHALDVHWVSASGRLACPNGSFYGPASSITLAAVSGTGGPAVQLPWEHRGGRGVCLSGGGIRAAAFALGALQAMQSKQGLLVGRDSAHYLSAVSGGSYIAAAFALNAKELGGTANPRPLSADSPEAKHIVSNGDYLKRWGRSSFGESWWLVTFGVMLAFGLFNFLGFVSLFALTGGVIAGIGDAFRSPMPSYSTAWGWGLGVAAAAAIWLLVRTLYIVPRPWKTIAPALAVTTVGAGALIDGSHETINWAEDRLNGITAADIVIAVSVIGIYLFLSFKRFKSEPVAYAAGFLSTLLPRFVGVALLAVSIELTSRIGLNSVVLVVVSTAAGFVLSVLLSRVSLHRLNRDRIAHCFAVQRSPSNTVRLVGPHTPLSDLEPPGWPDKNDDSFPRLLICTTANVRRRIGVKWETFEPFTLSHDFCWLPRDPDAKFRTSDLELGRRPAGLGSEPVLSLMTAVAAAGAAVSPSMGSKTHPGLRAVIALVNLRLGTWFPNTVSPEIRDEVASSDHGWWLRGHWWQPPKHVALESGYDEFVPELFGLDNQRAPRIYASDGGHYDNLGLLMLLRARCTEIWCVDSQADPGGAAGQLRRVVPLAEDAGLVTSISIDFDDFRRDGRWQKATHTIGHIEYPDRSTGKLIVVKLGLTELSPPNLLAYHDCDARFAGPLRHFLRYPHDNTFLRIAFSAERMESYRQLGYASTATASDALQAGR